jgi:hypothetical protein
MIYPSYNDTMGMFGSTPLHKKLLHSTNSTKLISKHVQLHQFQLQKKVELRARSTFFVEYLKRCSKNTSFVPTHGVAR